MEKITNSELGALGIREAELLASFSRAANGLLKHNEMKKLEILEHLEVLMDEPEQYLTKENKFKNLAEKVIHLRRKGEIYKKEDKLHKLSQSLTEFSIFGKEHIEQGALDQMITAMKLPVSVAGALMPDAHQGYGLPIGGVLATDASIIIPYAVGVDIACRMCLSVFDLPAHTADSEKDRLKKVLSENTVFGMGGITKLHFDTSLFDRKEWKATALIRSLRDKAYAQLGTSGTGNHFAEWGELSVKEGMLEDLPEGKYLALLTHSGSRGFGGKIASHYSAIAMKKIKLPAEAKHLAWLDLNSEEGQEYWLSMNLAGDYASANHHEIHNKIAHALKLEPVLRIENHHNFAWKEKLADGREVMVHRKGATPAEKGVLGIIPGSMSTPGFVVRGKGNNASINSASHGAGRLMSRNAALKTIKREHLEAELLDKKITLMGADLDEAPMVYKNIYTVMAAQTELVDILAEFQPRIVKMANPNERPED